MGKRIMYYLSLRGRSAPLDSDRRMPNRPPLNELRSRTNYRPQAESSTRRHGRGPGTSSDETGLQMCVTLRTLC